MKFGRCFFSYTSNEKNEKKAVNYKPELKELIRN